MKTIIEYQSVDGRWYELTCYDYIIKDDVCEEKLTSHNSARSEICPSCKGTGGYAPEQDTSKEIICDHCNGTGKLSPVA